MILLRRLAGAVMIALLAVLMSANALAATPEDYDPGQPSTLDSDLLYAESAFLFDMDTCEVLLSKNSKIRMYPASTTKIMTALLALESGIDLDDTVTIPKEAGNVPEGSSVIGIKPGDTMTWRDLLYGLMLRSGNDGSNAIAVLTAGSIDAFVEKMNQKAAELNCEGTHFVNAHGYHDSNHYTTAQDLARMALYAMQNETFREISATAHYELTVTRGGKTASTDAENRNSLVVPESDYYYPDATGIKTGHHSKAGRCVVASAERDGVRLMAVVMNCATEEQQFNDAKKLFEYGFTQYSLCEMSRIMEHVAADHSEVTVQNAAEDDPGAGQLKLILGEINGGDVTRMLQRDSEKAMNMALDDARSTLTVDWARELTAPIRAGEPLGTLRFLAPDGTTVSAQLLSARDVEARPEPTEAPTAEPRAETRRPVSTEDGNSVGFGGLLVGIVVVLVVSAALLVILRARTERKRRAAARRRAAAKKRRTAPAHNTGGRSASGTVQRPKKRPPVNGKKNT